MVPSNSSYLTYIMLCTFPPTFPTYSPLNTQQWYPPTTPSQIFVRRYSVSFLPPSLYLLLLPPISLHLRFSTPFLSDAISLCVSPSPPICPFPSPHFLSSPSASPVPPPFLSSTDSLLSFLPLHTLPSMPFLWPLLVCSTQWSWPVPGNGEV